MEHDTNEGNKQSKNFPWQNDFNKILSDIDILSVG